MSIYPVAPYTKDELMKAFNQAVLSLFLGDSQNKRPIVFLTSLYAGLQKSWDTSILTACTNGKFLKINPDFFMWLSAGMRSTVLAHETWHVGFLHCDPERRGDRDPSLWNAAIDYATNWMLFEQGYVFDRYHWENNPWGIEPGKLFGLLDERFKNMSAEQIYDVLWDEAEKVKVLVAAAGTPGDGTDPGAGGDEETPVQLPCDNPFDGDVEEVLTPAEKHELVGKVVQAIQQSQLASEPESIPGSITEVIENLLNPKLPWTTLLRKYCTERSTFSHDWKKPRRRYLPHGLYLPSRGSQSGLSNILFACDDSWSMKRHLETMAAEIAGICEELQPELLTVVTCDTEVQGVFEFEAGNPIERMVFTGLGGTYLEPVMDYVRNLAEKPKLLIFASDLEISETQIPTDPGIPVLWLRFGNRGWNPTYGEVIQIDD